MERLPAGRLGGRNALSGRGLAAPAKRLAKMAKCDLSAVAPPGEGGRTDPPSPKAMAGRDDESNPKFTRQWRVRMTNGGGRRNGKAFTPGAPGLRAGFGGRDRLQDGVDGNAGNRYVSPGICPPEYPGLGKRN